MPTYMLEGDSAVVISPRTLAVQLQLSGPDEARLDVVAGGAAVNAVRPRPGLVILPTLDRVVELRVVPTHGGTFAAGSVAHVSIGDNSPAGEDPEQVFLAAAPVEGLTSRTVATLEPTRRGVSVRASLDDERDASPDRLAPLARSARIAASEVLGTQRVDRDRARTVRVAVDGSASFRARLADGSCAAVLDIVEGVASVIAPGEPVAVSLAGAEWAPLAADHGSLGGAPLAASVEQIAASTPATGVRALAGVDARAATRFPPLDLLVTDDVPADLPTGGVPERVRETLHLVVVGDRSAWQLTPTPAVPTTFVDRALVANGAAARLAGDGAALRPIVEQLVRGATGGGADATAGSAASPASTAGGTGSGSSSGSASASAPVSAPNPWAEGAR